MKLTVFVLLSLLLPLGASFSQDPPKGEEPGKTDAPKKEETPTELTLKSLYGKEENWLDLLALRLSESEEEPPDLEAECEKHKKTFEGDPQNPLGRAFTGLLVAALQIDLTNELSGFCAKIVSGDTFRTRLGTLVKIAGIRAPEPGEPFEEEAKKFLTFLLTTGPLFQCKKVAQSSGVVEATCDFERVFQLASAMGGEKQEIPAEAQNFLGDTGLVMIASGLAFNSPDSSPDYSSEEKEALLAKRGIWSKIGPCPRWKFWKKYCPRS